MPPSRPDVLLRTLRLRQHAPQRGASAPGRVLALLALGLLGAGLSSPWLAQAQPAAGPAGPARAAAAVEAPPAVPAEAAAQPGPPPALQPGLRLRSSPRLQEANTAPRSQLPTYLFGDFLTGRPDLELVLDGRVEMRRGDTVIRADRLEYYQPDDLAKARGHVRINRGGSTYEGPELELKVDAFEGFFRQPSYRFLATQGYGEAERADFLDDKRAVIRNASYTTCQRTPGPSWLPDWLLRASTIRIDTEEEVGEAENAQLSFKGTTFLSLPEVSFALSDKRKSGFLAPVYGVDGINGTELAVPYYWNIAPNRDASFTPTLMTKRGVNYGGEFRYLESSYTGQLNTNYMPRDLLRDADRWGYAYRHTGVLQQPTASQGAVALSLNLNRVSDNDYWRDFPRGTAALTQRLLPNDLNLTWASGYYSAGLRALQWQTLQDVTTPITPPYDRLPQLTARFARLDVAGFDFSLDGDATQFYADPALRTDQPNGQRSFMLAQLSRPWLGSAGFIVPKLQMHTTAYQFDAPLQSNGERSAARTLPTFSLDSGLVFERDASYFGRSTRQTLEPRLFYVNTPYRDQSALPNYDSGLADFNFATIYSENAFAGNDRISDTHMLTAGVSTRLLNPDTGAERARFGIAQRYRFDEQRVTLPGGTPARERLSDVLLGASLNLEQRWVLDSTVQYNPTTEKSERATIGARYKPGNYRVLNLAYRFQRELSELLDVGWQWPLDALWRDAGAAPDEPAAYGGGRWYSVSRLNYSLKDTQLVDSILGLEYDAGCWIGRIVLERLSTGLTSSNQRIMFQLEFVGFSRVGIDPLGSLKRNIPRYQTLREQVGSPSRFSNYD